MPESKLEPVLSPDRDQDQEPDGNAGPRVEAEVIAEVADHAATTPESVPEASTNAAIESDSTSSFDRSAVEEPVPELVEDHLDWTSDRSFTARLANVVDEALELAQETPRDRDWGFVEAHHDPANREAEAEAEVEAHDTGDPGLEEPGETPTETEVEVTLETEVEDEVEVRHDDTDLEAGVNPGGDRPESQAIEERTTACESTTGDNGIAPDAFVETAGDNGIAPDALVDIAAAGAEVAADSSRNPLDQPLPPGPTSLFLSETETPTNAENATWTETPIEAETLSLISDRPSAGMPGVPSSWPALRWRPGASAFTPHGPHLLSSSLSGRGGGYRTRMGRRGVRLSRGRRSIASTAQTPRGDRSRHRASHRHRHACRTFPPVRHRRDGPTTSTGSGRSIDRDPARTKIGTVPRSPLSRPTRTSRRLLQGRPDRLPIV